MFNKFPNIKSILGYNLNDNVIFGFLMAILFMYISYYLQIYYYKFNFLLDYREMFIVPILKRSILGMIVPSLIFNFWDKLYSFKGALFAIILFVFLFFLQYTFHFFNIFNYIFF